MFGPDRICLYWFLGHSGIFDNETTDVLDKLFSLSEKRLGSWSLTSNLPHLRTHHDMGHGRSAEVGRLNRNVICLDLYGLQYTDLRPACDYLLVSIQGTARQEMAL